MQANWQSWQNSLEIMFLLGFYHFLFPWDINTRFHICKIPSSFLTMGHYLLPWLTMWLVIQVLLWQMIASQILLSTMIAQNLFALVELSTQDPKYTNGRKIKGKKKQWHCLMLWFLKWPLKPQKLSLNGYIL